MAMGKAEIKAMGVTEMKMLRWMCGWPRKDRVRNKKVRGVLQVAPIEEKLRESRLPFGKMVWACGKEGGWAYN